jgi:hypothetical protein
VSKNGKEEEEKKDNDIESRKFTSYDVYCPSCDSHFSSEAAFEKHECIKK